MRSFIYDKYGYYPSDEFATSFEYKGWYFKLELSEKNDYEIHSLRMILEQVNSLYKDIASDIIMTKDGHYVSLSEYGPVALVAIKQKNIFYEDIYKMHYFFKDKFNDTNLTISHIRNLWIDKIDLIENRILPSFSLNEEFYNKYNLLATYGIFLAENAVQYLLDAGIEYGNIIYHKTLAHKRFDDLSSFYLLSPFNLIIDSPSRDLSLLIKGNLISTSELIQILNSYDFDGQDASVLMARLLYPDNIFDIFEDRYELKKDIKQRAQYLLNNLESYEMKLYKINKYLVSKYGIRPISWLDY